MVTGPDSRSKPSSAERTAGTLFWASAAVALVLFLAGGEVEVLQDIPGVAFMFFFGEKWLHEHSTRLGYDRTRHPAHYALNIGKEIATRRIKP